MFTNDEKKLLKTLVKGELEKFESADESIRPVVPQFLAGEEKYELFLRELLKKL